MYLPLSVYFPYITVLTPNIVYHPFSLGSQFKHFSPQGYMSGGAGYLFNREGLKALVEKGYNIPARCRDKGTFVLKRGNRAFHWSYKSSIIYIEAHSSFQPSCDNAISAPCSI